MGLVRFPAAPRGVNDNEPFSWMICNRCGNPAILAKFDAGMLFLLCAECGHDLTAGLLELIYPSSF